LFRQSSAKKAEQGDLPDKKSPALKKVPYKHSFGFFVRENKVSFADWLLPITCSPYFGASFRL